MSLSNIKSRSRAALGGSIFGAIWMLALLAFLIQGAAMSIVSATVIGFLVVTGPLSIGFNSIHLKLARGVGNVDLSDLAYGFMNGFTDNLLLGVMYTVKVFLWSLLFVIPGIVKAYAYSMAYYIKIDHPEYDWRTCLKESEKMMLGNKGKMFLLDLSFIGWIIIGALCLGVGTLWVQVWIDQSHAQFYEALKQA